MDNYSKLVERISTSAGIEVQEIERRVEGKRAKLSGLISKEGAAQIVAAELGISFESEKMKISELVHGMKRVNLTGKITRIFPVREYSKNGREGKVANLLIGDDTSNTKAVLWDTNHISLIENNTLAEGDVIEIGNASVRNGEVHLSAFSDIKKSNEKFDNIFVDRQFGIGKIKDGSSGKNMKVKALIVQVFEPRTFEDKKVPGKKRAVCSFVLDDGSETIRAVMFDSEMIRNNFIKEDDIQNGVFDKLKENLLGEEKLFSGNFKDNTYFNTLEFYVEKAENIDLDSWIKEMESKV